MKFRLAIMSKNAFHFMNQSYDQYLSLLLYYKTNTIVVNDAKHMQCCA